MNSSHRLVARIALIAIVAAAVAGCNLFGTDDDSEPNQPVTPVDRHRGTPDSLVGYFARMTADSARDAAEVIQCLHPDFRFYFTEGDRQGDPTLPEYLSREEFGVAIAAMQDSAVSITMMLTQEGPPLGTMPCNPADSTGAACQQFTFRVTMAVEIRDDPYPEALTLLVNGLSDFYVTADPDEPGLWVIHSIYDRTSTLGRGIGASPGSESNTWGAVLSLWL